VPKALLPSSPSPSLDKSLYQALAEAGVPVHHALASLTPVAADNRLARTLAVPAGSPLLHIEQVDFTPLGSPAMYSSEWHVPGVFDLTVNRRPLDPLAVNPPDS